MPNWEPGETGARAIAILPRNVVKLNISGTATINVDENIGFIDGIQQ